MNHILMSPVKDDADNLLRLDELEKNWRQQSLSPYQIFNDFVQSDPELIDDFPLQCLELAEEKSELEACVARILQQEQDMDVVIAAITCEVDVYPLIERMLVIESAIGRMKAKWFSHYHVELGIVQHRKGRPEAEIQLARETSILIVGEKVGLSLKKAGIHYRCCCPLHQEKTPSFTCFVATNSWYCFGCHLGGDGIRLVEKVLGYDFPQAVRFIIS